MINATNGRPMFERTHVLALMNMLETIHRKPAFDDLRSILNAIPDIVNTPKSLWDDNELLPVMHVIARKGRKYTEAMTELKLALNIGNTRVNFPVQTRIPNIIVEDEEILDIKQ